MYNGARKWTLPGASRKPERFWAMTFQPNIVRALPATLALIALAALAGCSSTNGESGGGSKLANLFVYNTSTPTTVNPVKEAAYCPPVTVQPGTAAFTLYERGQEGSILAVKNQANFGTLARECADLGSGQIGVRIGVSGRLMAGPKGVAGSSVDVPVRFVVLNSEDKPVFSRVTRIQAVIPPGQTGVSFTHVEDLGAFPVDERGLKNWSLRIGFETAAAAKAR
jgi:hypothetical protein